MDLPDWDLTLGESFEGGQAAWVAPAVLRDGTRAVLKLGFPRDRRPALLAAEHPRRVVAARLDQLAEILDLDRERARGWAIVHALVWGLDETLHPDLVACAELFQAA